MYTTRQYTLTLLIVWNYGCTFTLDGHSLSPCSVSVIEKWQQQIIKLLLRLYTPLDSRRKDIYSTPDHLLHPDPHRILFCGD